MIDPLGTSTWQLDAVGTLLCAVELGGGSWLGGDVTVGYVVDAESL